MTDYSSIVPASEDGRIVRRNPGENFYLVMREDGSVTLEAHTDCDMHESLPEDVYSYRTLVWGISGSILDAERLREDLSEGGLLAVLLDQVRSGHLIDVGDDGKRFCFLTEDAAAASFDLFMALEAYADGGV